MENEFKFMKALEDYVRLRAKKDTAITIKLKAKIAEMNSDELDLAEQYYEKLLESDIRTLGEIGCVELAIELARWLYPRILREAYAEGSKSYMLAP